MLITSERLAQREMATVCHRKRLPAVLFLLLFFSGVARAQTEVQRVQDEGEGRQQARESERRAQQAADELVSLSAKSIQQILLREPGLLLAVKKALVRKAYEQGRLLDPADLTDEALFELLREDNNVRVLATREIESRMYVRAKPNPEELSQAPERRIVGTRELPQGTSEGQQSPPQSQEAQYWSTHETVPQRTPVPGGFPPSATQQTMPGPGEPSSSEPGFTQPWPSEPWTMEPWPVPAGPDNGAPEAAPDNRPPQNFAQAPEPELYSPDVLPSDAETLPRVSPSGLPGLLSASMAEPAGTNSNRNRGYANSGASIYGSVPSPDADASPWASSGWGRQSFGAMETEPRFRWPSSAAWSRARQPDYAEPTIRHQPNPYADVPSLYDLYQQVSQRPPVLERFGIDVFRNGTGNFNQLPMDTPAGPDYVVGPGDGLNIEIWGSVSGHLQRVVDRQGMVSLPETGGVEVAGKTLAEVQQLVENALRSQYRQAEADVSLGRLRTVRVYVVGDVVRPGAYEVSALSTPLNALYLAGGPTARGSLRVLRHLRGNQLLETIDVYDLLLHGVREDGLRLQAGDTIQVPPLGPEVTVEGMVRRPAIYELNGETGMAQVLEIAGGVLTSGTLRHIEIERVVAHENRTMLQVDLPEGNDQQAANRTLADFSVEDGDTIRISPILPFSEKTVYLEGHVFHPGKYAYREGMRFTDLVHSYQEVLPEPALGHAEIIRLNPPDFAPSVLAFNLADAMAGRTEVTLKPFDTVRIFGRFDFEPPPLVTVSGEVLHPGDHLTNGQTTLRDAIYLAGGPTPDALLSDAQLFHRTPDGRLHVISVNLRQALAGNPADNILLRPMDRVFIHRNLGKADPPTVKIEGEVAQPGKYPLGENMTAADLVRLAGGLKRGAYTESADLTRYEVEQGSNLVGEHTTVPLARALAGEPDSDARLRDGDVLTIRQLAGWRDMGATIAVGGEVVHPGTYGIQEGERLSSILQRAGGFRADAYPYGVILERVQVRELEQANRDLLLKQVQMDGSNLSLIPASDDTEKTAKEAAVDQWHATLEKLQSSPPSGRLAIRIGKDIRRWQNTPADIEVRAGDTLYVPKKPNFVMVEGAVYNPTAVAYKPGKSAGWYLAQAGGPTNMANRKAVFVIRADGFVAGGSGGLLSGGVLHDALQPGDLVMVPERAFSGTTKWKTTLESAQMVYAVGVAIQVARSF